MSTSPYAQLEQEWRRLHAFHGVLALLRWDAAVMMPRGSADVRGEQLAALETEHHALLTAPKITRLLDRAQANAQGLEDWQLANLHEMRRQRDHATRDAGVIDIAARQRARPRAPRRSGRRRAARIISSCSRRIWKRSCTWCATRPRCFEDATALGLLSLLRARRRVLAGRLHGRHRRHIQDAVAPAARPDPRSADLAGAASDAEPGRQVRGEQAALAGGGGDAHDRLSIRSRATR